MDVPYILHFNKGVQNSSSPPGHQRKWIQGKLKHHNEYYYYIYSWGILQML